MTEKLRNFDEVAAERAGLLEEWREMEAEIGRLLRLNQQLLTHGVSGSTWDNVPPDLSRLTGEWLDEIRRLRAINRQLLEAAKRIKQYDPDHLFDCAVCGIDPDVPPQAEPVKCTCGFSEAWESLCAAIAAAEDAK